MNGYDPFVANKMVDVYYMTITCHVDDIKLSHKVPLNATDFSMYQSNIYGNIKLNIGVLYKNLGVYLDYSFAEDGGVFIVSMYKYIDKF